MRMVPNRPSISLGSVSVVIVQKVRYLTSVYELVGINLYFFRHCKSTPFHTVIRIHLIVLLSHILVLAI